MRSARSQSLGEILNEMGVLPPECTRMVIDIKAGAPVRVYFETIGSEKLTEVLRLDDVVAAIKEASARQNPS